MEQVVLTVVRVRWQDGVVVLTMSGELDVFTADHLDRKFAALAAAGHSRIALDVAGLSFCDACGLRVLIRASDRAEAGHGWLRLVAVVPRVRRVVVITRMTRVLPMFATLDHALDPALASGRPAGSFGPRAEANDSPSRP